MIQATVSRETHERELAKRHANIAGLQRQLHAVLRLLKTGKSEPFVPVVDAAQGSLFALPEAEDTPVEKQTVRYEREVRPKKEHPGRCPSIWNGAKK